MDPIQVFGLVKNELREVEKELVRQGESSVGTITDIGKYLQESGGKRIRPSMLLLCTRLCGEVNDAAIKLAAVVEFIHAATLVHDDIIDGAETRRGRSSVNSRWGNQVTVLAGDWFYMQSFNIALQQRNFQILDTLIDLTQRMVEGELDPADLQWEPSDHGSGCAGHCQKKDGLSFCWLRPDWSHSRESRRGKGRGVSPLWIKRRPRISDRG